VTGALKLSDGRVVPVRDGLVLGRVAGCDVVIDDVKASRRHARLIVQGGVVEIEDMGSSNGTLLNGKPVQRRVLRVGDEVCIGATTIVYEQGQPAAAPAADLDVDLFGDDVPSAPPAAPPPSPPLPAAPPMAPPPVVPPRSTVEFVDEIVEVRKAPAPAARPTAPTVGAGVQQKQRVLQFSQQSKRGPLGDDLAQMGGGMKLLIVAAVALGALGLAWLAMTLVS
jgi:hypothetical protein